MKIMIQNNYLIFPVYTHATEKQLVFFRRKEPVFSLNIKLDNVSPDFWAYVDVSLFKNELLEVSVTPEMPIIFKEADEISPDNLYHEHMRPQAHFTAKNGWMGVPNALIRSEGGYVLIYPHNPAETAEGNAQWGYAVSKDLIHWTQEPAPVFPECESIFFRGYERLVFDTLSKLRERGEQDKTKDFALTVNGEQKWISVCENGGYLVGEQKDGVFVAEQEKKTLRYGGSVREGVTLADTKDGRVIRMDWDGCLTSRFCGQMSIPMEISLEKGADGYTLLASPVKEIQSLYKNTNHYEHIEMEAGKLLEIPLADSAHLIHLKGKAEKEGFLHAVLFGREICVNFAENRIRAGGAECPISVADGSLDLTILVDRCGMEIFADGGRIYMSCLSENMFMDRNLLSLVLRCHRNYCADLLEIHALESIW